MIQRILRNSYRCISSFRFGMDGPLPVDQGVSRPGSPEVDPEEQGRADGILSSRILPAEHRNPCRPPWHCSALKSPEPH
jgi:hypothetical protein